MPSPVVGIGPSEILPEIPRFRTTVLLSYFSTNSLTKKKNKVEILRKYMFSVAYEYNASPDVKYKGVITFGAQVCMNDDPSLVRQVYSLGTWVQIGVSMILAGLFPVTVDPKVTSQVINCLGYQYSPFLLLPVLPCVFLPLFFFLSYLSSRVFFLPLFAFLPVLVCVPLPLFPFHL